MAIISKYIGKPFMYYTCLYIRKISGEAHEKLIRIAGNFFISVWIPKIIFKKENENFTFSKELT